MGKKVKKALSSVTGGLIGGTDDAAKALARQQEQQAQMALDAQAELRNVDRLEVVEGASAEVEDPVNSDPRKRRPKQGLAGALGLGGL